MNLKSILLLQNGFWSMCLNTNITFMSSIFFHLQCESQDWPKQWEFLKSSDLELKQCGEASIQAFLNGKSPLFWNVCQQSESLH